LRFGRDVFESAQVDSIVTTIGKKDTETIAAYVMDSGLLTKVATVDISSLGTTAALDQVFSEGVEIVEKMESFKPRLSDFASCESACATSDCYALKQFISVGGKEDVAAQKTYKVVNTGTLDKFVFKWGLKPMRYLKDDYLTPVVDRSVFAKEMGATYVRRAKSKKLIVKGLTLLDAALDLAGDFIPGKSTLVITHENEITLKMLAALINSKLASYYVNEKYSSSSYNGGVVFTKDMLNQIPIAFDEEQGHRLVGLVDCLIDSTSKFNHHCSKFLALLVADLGLEKIGKKIRLWHLLSANEFLDELRKKKVSLPLSKKQEWVPFFEKEKSIALELALKIEEKSEGIDQIIFGFYGLSNDEIEKVLKSSR
jgi:hypothetical protein